MQFHDTVALDGVRRTKDGYLVAEARVARTGIQIYAGAEVGRPELNSVRVYRPDAEVFAKDAMASFAHRPLTLDHPPEMVTADNWRTYAVGQTGDEVARDRECIRVAMLAMDAAAIGAIDAGKRELSMGYTCDLAWEPGTTDDGEDYDAVQRNIRANHLAVVTAARGGSHLRIGDAPSPGDLMKTDKDALEALNIELATQRSALEAKDAEIATLRKQLADATLTPAQLREVARVHMLTIAQAKRIAPSVAIDEAMDSDAIRKAVVLAKMGDAAKDWSESQFDTSFQSFAASLTPPPHDPLRAALRGGLASTAPTDACALADAAYGKSVDGLNAWRAA